MRCRFSLNRPTAGRTTLKRVRHRFGFHVNNDTTEFYTERIHDLETLTPREFAAKHSVNPDVACHRRFRILGRQTRELGWWREPKFLRVLLSGMTLVRMARKLGIGTTHACRLRRRAQEELQGRLPQAA